MDYTDNLDVTHAGAVVELQ